MGRRRLNRQPLQSRLERRVWWTARRTKRRPVKGRMSSERANGHPHQQNLHFSRWGNLATGTRTSDVKDRGNFIVLPCTHLKTHAQLLGICNTISYIIRNESPVVVRKQRRKKDCETWKLSITSQHVDVGGSSNNSINLVILKLKSSSIVASMSEQPCWGATLLTPHR